jgi:16S rRNA (guanine1516-N2)-methyltransferase
MISTPRIAITAIQADLHHKATQLARALNLPCLSDSKQAQPHYDYLLVVTPDYLGIQKLGHPTPFYIDFLTGKLHYRHQQAGIRKELLARALGVKSRDNPLIIDATAGLGRDSFILASLGFRVIMLERAPIVCALLNDALERAQQDSQLAPTLARLQLIQTNAIDWLKTTTNTPTVIYLDPMFPERKKSAAVKKEMVLLQDLVGKNADDAQLLETALTCAAKRVVVKRPRLAVTLTERAPDFSLTGKTSRFDIYLVKQ